MWLLATWHCLKLTNKETLKGSLAEGLWLSLKRSSWILFSLADRLLISIKYFLSRAIGLNALRDWIYVFPAKKACEKYLKDNTHYSLDPFVAKKYSRIFVLGHYLLLEADSWDLNWVSNCSLLVRLRAVSLLLSPSGMTQKKAVRKK